MQRDVFRAVKGRNRVAIRSRIRRRQRERRKGTEGVGLASAAKVRNRSIPAAGRKINRSIPTVKGASSRIIKWLPILLGLMFGIGLFLLFEERILRDELFFGRRLFESGRSVEYVKSGFLFYLIKTRGIQVAIVILFMGLHKRKQGLSLWGIITGVGFGIGGYAMFRRLGMSGILGYFMMIMPHYLCYLSAYGICWDIDYNSQLERGFMGKMTAGLGVVIIGILLECYVNPFFIKLFINLFL